MLTPPLDAVAPHPTEKEGLADLGKLTAYWRGNKAFRILKGWRNELWPVYGRNGELLHAAHQLVLVCGTVFGNIVH